MQPAIRVENLGKRYKIGLREEATQNFREALVGLATAPLRRLRALRERTGEDETIWALRDVSFEVQPGEVVGIIGRNGAGKTTLLKILSRITEPTEGRAELSGRVASLLEVGTGFHPELTGRENIYLNGAILGMKKAEIDRRFDQIVAFAEIDKFLDTPVKRYSSGMRVRLGFAVAAHLEPEVLVIDEVLAVGDVAFQRKCLGRMKDVATGGRTVLFVSHNMAAIENLCDRVVLLEHGSLLFDAGVSDAIERYLAVIGSSPPSSDLADIPRAPGFSPIIQRVELTDLAGQPIAGVGINQPFVVVVYYRCDHELEDPGFAFFLETQQGQYLARFNSRTQSGVLQTLPAEGALACHVKGLPLCPGTYFITPWCGSRGRRLDQVDRAVKLEIVPRDLHGTGKLSPSKRFLLELEADWTVCHPRELSTSVDRGIEG